MKEYQDLQEINEEIQATKNHLQELEIHALKMKQTKDYFPYNYNWAQEATDAIFTKLYKLDRVGKALQFYSTKEQQSQLNKEFTDIIKKSQSSYEEAIRLAQLIENAPPNIAWA